MVTRLGEVPRRALPIIAEFSTDLLAISWTTQTTISKGSLDVLAGATAYKFGAIDPPILFYCCLPHIPPAPRVVGIPESNVRTTQRSFPIFGTLSGMS